MLLCLLRWLVQACDIGDVKVYVVVHVYQVRCGNQGAVSVEDTMFNVVCDSPCEGRPGA